LFKIHDLLDFNLVLFSFSGKMVVSPLRRRPGLVGVLIAIPLVILLLASSPDMTSENELAERLADLQARLQQLDSLHRARREEVQVRTLYCEFCREISKWTSPLIFIRNCLFFLKCKVVCLKKRIILVASYMRTARNGYSMSSILENPLRLIQYTNSAVFCH